MLLPPFFRRRHLPRVYFAFNRRRSHSRRNPLPILFCILCIILALTIFSATRIAPIVTILARSEARDCVISAINNAIADEAVSGTLNYSHLVTLEKDYQGNITALMTNSALINVLQSKISQNVVDNVQNVIDANMSIPIGNAFGGVLLAGRGPRIPVKIQSVSNIETKISNDFSSAGINQTRHKIMLEITAVVHIILPGSSDSTTVSAEAAIAETVIVGSVPNVYTDIGRLPNAP